MGTPNERKATYADIERLPENMVGEILDGELVATPRPAGPHTLTGSTLGQIIGGRFQLGDGGPGGWWILDEPELHFGENVIVPDLAGWRRERMPRIPDVAAFELAPDWACEVLSKSTRRYDRGPKMRIYRKAMVPWLWLVDHGNRAIEVYRLTENGWSDPEVFEGQDRVRIPPFDAVEIQLAQLWGE